MSTLTIQTLSENSRKYAIEFNSIVEAKNPKSSAIYNMAFKYWKRKCFIFDINAKVIGNTEHWEYCPFPEYLEKCALEYKRDCMS